MRNMYSRVCVHYSECCGDVQVEGVVSVHDLHVWALKPGVPLLAAHLDVEKGQDACAVLMAATKYCVSKGITHTTIQLLHNDLPCCVPAQS